MKIGLLFGSFNPIHNGHLIIADGLMQAAQVEQVWFVLSPQNPFKEEYVLLSYENRLRMLRQAIRDEPAFQACTIENDLPKPSYTIDTMKVLRERYSDMEFCIFGGEDLLSKFRSWKSWEELLASHHIYLYKRKGYLASDIQHNNIHLIELPLIDISSTHIRERVADKKSIKGMVPDSVNALILHYGWFS